VLEYIRPHIDYYKVDLKIVRRSAYRELGGRLAPILDTIRRLHALDVWLEIVTLLVPGFNDDADEIDRLTAFVASVSPDIPWHVTAFHQDYKMTDHRDTRTTICCARPTSAGAMGCGSSMRGIGPARSAISRTRAARAAARPSSHASGITCKATGSQPDGTCPSCGTKVPGRWDHALQGRSPITRSCPIDAFE
jgi:pyruvate formate lyase activating enzyme